MMVHNNGLVDNRFTTSSTYARWKDRVDVTLIRIEEEDISKLVSSVVDAVTVVSNLYLKEYYERRNKVIAILMNKDGFISNIKKKYNIDLSHLEEECSAHSRNIGRPLVFTEQSVSGVINAFDKVLVEGFNVEQLRVLYEALYLENERDSQYKKWQSIRLIKEILIKLCSQLANTVDIENLISLLYILHDYRIYLDHLLSLDKQESTKSHIVATLGVQDFGDQETIYSEEINRLNKLFQYLVLLSK